jgi:outer membrane protein OmpU
MKKIIALAVAGAFVAPVYAADVSVSGFIELGYVDSVKTTGTTKSVNEESAVKVTATSEITGGTTVTADINLNGAGKNDGGNSITLAGAFGKLAVGDESGAIDSFDGGDIFFIAGNQIGGGASDASINWTAPTFAEGLTVVVAHSPKEGTVAEDGANVVKGDLTGFGVRYAMGPVSVAYAIEDVGTTDNTFAQVKGSVAGISAMYEMNESDAAGTKTDFTAMTVVYSVGNTTFAYGAKTTKPNGSAKTADQTSFGIHQDLGGGLTLFVESSDDNTATEKPSIAAVGLEYSF